MRTVQALPGGGIQLGDASEPRPTPSQVVVRVIYGGICGSDLHYAAHGRNGNYAVKTPLVLGHEIVGVVETIGSAVPYELSLGDPVAIHPARPTPEPGGVDGKGLHLAGGGSYLGSASTDPHTAGGFTDRLAVEGVQIRRLPEGLPLRRAALAEPAAVALHAVNQISADLSTSRVLVAGAGPIGSLVIAILIDHGAVDVAATDLAEHPLRVARAVGATRTYQLGVDEEPADESFDLIVESSGSPRSLNSAVRWIARGGTIVQLGLPPAGQVGVELAAIVSKEIQLRGSQRFDVELDATIEILSRRPNVDWIVTHVFDVNDADTAFSTAADPAISSKVLLQFGKDPS